MEENWERRTEVIKLEEPVFTEMLQPVLAGRRVVATQALTSGHANTNYKVWLDSTDQPLVLRLHIRDSNACQKEFNIFKALHTKVPMAQILYAEPSSARFGFPYSILGWVDGVLLDSIATSNDILAVTQTAYDVGAKLAAIGSYRFSEPGLIDQNLAIALPFTSTADSWLSFIQRCLFEGHSGKQLGEVGTQRLWQFVNKNVQYLAELPESNVLVHADFKGSNILIGQTKPGWQVTAVLDWEFAYAGSPLADIGPLLRYQAQFNPAFETNFIRGFEEHDGKLPHNWKQIVRLLDLLNLCDFLNRPQLSAVMRRDVIQLITDTIES